MNKQIHSSATIHFSRRRLRAALGAAGLFVLGAGAMSPASAGAVDGGSHSASLAHGLADPFAHAEERHGAGHNHEPGASGTRAIDVSYRGQTLAGVVDDLSRRSGIEFKVPAELSKDLLNRSATANTWADAVKTLLKGYNYAGYSGDNGKLNRVVVTGRNGDGIDAVAAAPTGPSAAVNNRRNEVLAYQARAGELPEKYRGYPEGSVSPIAIPFDRLHKMKMGEKVPLSLPTGEYEVVHDNAFQHQNGDKTWVGYLDQEGKEYRVVLTSGKDGGVGQIISPDGEYDIALEDGGNYLVNVNAAGLTHGSLDDQAVDETELVPNPAEGSTVKGSETPVAIGTADFVKASRDVARAMGLAADAAPTTKKGKNTQTGTTTTDSAATTDSTTTTSTVNACSTTGPIIVNGVDQCSTVVPSVIDVLVAYTSGMETTGLDTRLNQLIALTNQAYKDSHVVMALRLVGKTKVSYTETNANSTALSDLANGGNYGSGALASIKNLRSQLGADLVVLIRPFYYSTQKNCGFSYINGANKTSPVASKGYATVSDGSDRAGTAYYCNNYTFAHETGHSLGSVHDRANTSTAGAYDFSYGWGVSGTVGTIMSYLRPQVGLYSNPDVLCKNMPCGVSTTGTNPAAVAASLNLTGSKVAKFLPKMVP